MKEDVSRRGRTEGTRLTRQMDFQGNQLNYLDTLFRIGYAIFLIVSSSVPLLFSIMVN